MAAPSPARPRSPLAVILLALLAEGPMHPYRMQQLIKHRGKDRVANVAQPNSVYQTIDALQRAGLVAVHATDREARRPERTVYTLTTEGARTLDHWLATLLSLPPRDFPDFPAALSLIALLEPTQVQGYLESRATALAARLADLASAAAQVPDLPRLFLIEDEYERAILEAELHWLRRVIADLASGALTWSRAELETTLAHLDAPPHP